MERGGDLTEGGVAVEGDTHDTWWRDVKLIVGKDVGCRRTPECKKNKILEVSQHEIEDGHIANGRNRGWLRSVKTPISAAFRKESMRYLGRMVGEGGYG